MEVCDIITLLQDMEAEMITEGTALDTGAVALPVEVAAVAQVMDRSEEAVTHNGLLDPMEVWE